MSLDRACQTDNNITENIEPLPAKHPRKPNFTSAACAVIFEEAKRRILVYLRASFLHRYRAAGEKLSFFREVGLDGLATISGS